MTPNPSLELTRYGRRHKAGRRHMVHIAYAPFAARLRGQRGSNVRHEAK